MLKYPHPAIQAGGQPLQIGEGHGSHAGRYQSDQRWEEERGSSCHAEKVVPTNRELLRPTEKVHKVTIKDLLEENQKLEARAKASESGKMKDRMERAKLESELQNIQRLVDRIPPDVLAELKRQQRYTKER